MRLAATDGNNDFQPIVGSEDLPRMQATWNNFAVTFNGNTFPGQIQLLK